MRQSGKEWVSVEHKVDWGCGESASDEWFECTDMDGEEDESYTESGPDIVLSIIRSWKTCVAMNCPRNAADDVEMSFHQLLAKLIYFRKKLMINSDQSW